ncbi:MAG: NAD-dependent DNA ligase LigA [Proteobacteria bacterium]|nr:MAG: NAD-dependent DNA ligase LigA [Pseudomonadota bacterium]
MTKAYSSARVEELSSKIMELKVAYYAGRPSVSDITYDRLEAELKELSPEHPALSYVGAAPSSGAPKANHDAPMLSLSKTYVEDELLGWMGENQIIGTPKVDGNSISLIYEGGALRLGKTRGNGRTGEVVTDKVYWISDCVPKLKMSLNLEVRGEIYCTGKQFSLLVEEMMIRGLERPTSPRNIVAGILGRKAHIDLSRYFNFYAFDVIGVEGLQTEEEKMNLLRELDFRVVPHLLIKQKKDVSPFLLLIKTWMDAEDVAFDGAVFSYNSLATQNVLGNTGHHPRYKMAFKWPGSTAEAKIERIEWATSRLGILTPVAVITPVELSGAMITNVTLHNAAHVRDYDLKAGDTIEIIRSGEVIPKFLSVVDPAEGSYTWPKVCPSCDSELFFDEVRLKCLNTSECQAQHSGFILNWMKSVDIEDISEKRLEEMMKIDLIENVSNLYTLTVDDFLKLPATKLKMAEKLYANIQASKTLPLSKFLTGLGIEGTGQRTWEKLIEHYHDLNGIRRMTASELVKIEGFALKSAEQIIEGLEKRSIDIDALLEVGVVPFTEARRHAPGEGPMAGLSIVITGALSMPREKIEAMIKEAGGKASSSVSKATSALVTNEGEASSSKGKKAKELGIPIWTEAELMEKLK